MTYLRSIMPSPDLDDPLAMAIAPPVNESEEQRALRERDEVNARRVSEEIDAQLKTEKLALKKKKKCVKVLLLGQSESGKSTTIKNFQINYAYRAWSEERASWRAVIQLNLVRSVNTILDILSKEMTPSSVPSSPTSPRFRLPSSPSLSPINTSSPYRYPSDEQLSQDLASSSSASGSSTIVAVPRSSSRPRTQIGPRPRYAFSERHKLLKLRLQPLRRIQTDLEIRLGSAASSESESSTSLTSPTYLPSSFNDYDRPGTGVSSINGGIFNDLHPVNPHRPREFFVRSNSGWKAALCKVRPRLSVNTRLDDTHSNDEKFGGVDGGVGLAARERLWRKSQQKQVREVEDEATEVIAECREDIEALWNDEIVRSILSRRKLKLEDSPGFFLDDVQRIASRDYEPSDNDIVRARLRTMGVQEYKMKFEKGSEAGREWIFYDVGGSRSCRAAWFPYFDDINAIIFLAPISCFDESLSEDKLVNRLDDSLLLWKSLCSCPLLTRVQLVLFLNKYDLLEKKLNPKGKGGEVVQVKDYVPGYGDRSNDAPSVAKFFGRKFKELSQQFSPEPRGFYAFLTSVIDTKATSITLETVREGLMRNHLKEAKLIP
ncbi:hypothetical protein JAAARDRAFT_39301 [Jaapia argillacea MUCL 33604]|uniref:G-alpha-domain-containing protein n=1 Tax=Jaapia argillacea MUCL 33604 TaxID=933084 RepID=A0A067PQM6_9AGAM|nr:hypothetical protein JAAARDRAFT_39301 [Jaapia argillacea MUCL 33604]